MKITLPQKKQVLAPPKVFDLKKIQPKIMLINIFSSPNKVLTPIFFTQKYF